MKKAPPRPKRRLEFQRVTYEYQWVQSAPPYLQYRLKETAIIGSPRGWILEHWTEQGWQPVIDRREIRNARARMIKFLKAKR